MSQVKIYYNPRCLKCRETLVLVNEKGVKAEIVEYLKNIPDEKELKGVLKKLNMKAEELVRTKETLYKEKFQGKHFSEVEWLTILIENPILIERPIIVKGNKAVIGRPPEKVLELWK